MDRELWINGSFTLIDPLPQWYCPTCKKYLLKGEKDEFHFVETIESKNIRKIKGWEEREIFDTRYRFTGTLKCSNPSCKDVVIFSGTGSMTYAPKKDKSGAVYTVEAPYFVPQYFNPPLYLFEINKDCPEKIATAIYDSFGLYWYDESSCANKIRIVVEIIMNQQRVRKTSEKKGKRLNLHQRIEFFERKKPDIAKHLFAIKFIGNDGSHMGKITTDDLIDAYTLLEYSINNLYGNEVK